MEPRSDTTTLVSLNYILPTIILIEGFVSIAIEIILIRQLLPVAGGSVIVTSLIIGFFLLFLAIGYQQGGKYNTDIEKRLQNNFIIASLWLGIGLSYPFVETFFYYVQKVFGFHIVIPLMLYLIIVVSPLIFMLGQTIPICMNMIKREGRVGRIGGSILSLSTLGSFSGAIATSLVCMYFFGVAATIVFNVILLQVLSLLLAKSNKQFVLQFFLAIGLVVAIYNFNMDIEHQRFVLTDNYANYEITQTPNDEKILIINNALSSHIDKQMHAYPYAELIKRILFQDMQLKHANILVLGAGGFTISAEKSGENNFTYVDIDKKIKAIVVPKFLTKINGKLIVDDARHYLQTTDQIFDVIINDSYSDLKAIPSHLATREYMLAIDKRLKENGIAMLNIIANPMLNDVYSKTVDNTIRSVFSNCMAMPRIYANQYTNILYTCHHTKRIEKKIYSDNINTSTTDSFYW